VNRHDVAMHCDVGAYDRGPLALVGLRVSRVLADLEADRSAPPGVRRDDDAHSVDARAVDVLAQRVLPSVVVR
jgi:hypothetical protein